MHEAKENESKLVNFLGVEFPESEFIDALNDYEEWLDFVANEGREKHGNGTTLV